MNRKMNRLKVVLAETKRTNLRLAECLGVTVQELISKNSTKDHE